MSLARARILLIHNSAYLLLANFAAVMVLAFLLTPINDPLSLVIVSVVVVAVIAWSTRLAMQHTPPTCPRCAELRPAISARIEGIDSPRKRLRAYRRSHFAFVLGAPIMLYAVFHVVSVAVWQRDNPADIYAGVIVGELILMVGLVWVAYSLARHLQYHADRCPWCKYRRERRAAREIIIALEIIEKRGESE